MKPTRLFSLLRFLLPAALTLTAAAQSNYLSPYNFTTLAGISSLGSTDGIGASARFHNPSGVTIDPSGNLYVADENNHIIRKITPGGNVSTFAGMAGQFGDADGMGSAARFYFPGGVVSDATGNIYVADSANHTIRKITPAGVVSTVAGTAGAAGSVDGNAKAAQFNYPAAIAFDSAGNAYVADSANQMIRKITPAGEVTTLAGSPRYGYNGAPAAFADGTGSAAKFWYPQGIAADGAGNVYVADTSNQTVRKITPAGEVTTFAGFPQQGGYADGTGSSARISLPLGLAIDAAGNIYVADTGNKLIRKITPAGVTSTVAGTAGVSGSADGAATSASFFAPNGIAVDASGNLYITDGPSTSDHRDNYGNSLAPDDCGNTVRKISSSGVVSTVAGLAVSYGNNDGTGAAARFGGMTLIKTSSGSGTAIRFGGITDIAIDPAGNSFVVDSGNHTIRKISPTGVVSTFAGTSGVSGFTDGVGAAARFWSPRGIAIDAAANLYVTDSSNCTVRKITPAGVVTTLAGSPGTPGYEDGTGSNARFGNLIPLGPITADAAGNVYLMDNYAVRKITSAGVVSTFAGWRNTPGYKDATGTDARFINAVGGITASADGTLYVADWNGIRKITPAGVVTTLAGPTDFSTSPWGSSDGTGTTARFNALSGLAVDGSGTIYATDTGNELIRRITPAGMVTTLAGLVSISGSTDGLGSAARFNSPQGIAVDSTGGIYVTTGSAIRKGQLASAPMIITQPASQTAAAGSNVQFSVSAGGVPAPTYQWYFNGGTFSGATTDTLSFTNARNADAGDYTVIVTNSLGSITSNKATLTVGAATALTPAPAPGSSGGGSISAWFALALLALAATRGHVRSRRTIL